MAQLLVVEDERSLRELYQLELESEGHEILLAKDGIEAVELVEKSPPDLIIMDIRMPRMDGLEAMGKILDRYKKIPVIINTAYQGYKDNFLSWNADAYVVKSSDMSELKAKISEILTHKKNR
ncbi:MAG TPA: response regulator [bacterium]|nr:response regulator [bacterium]HPO10536.1 response regulator [bacterium]HQO34611.1 response regulator [bacterium]HQP99041.1 response regulator [bacterium]